MLPSRWPSPPGPAAVTIRAISSATGVSNGAVYHTFGSRAGVLARAWLRAGNGSSARKPHWWTWRSQRRARKPGRRGGGGRG